MDQNTTVFVLGVVLFGAFILLGNSKTNVFQKKTYQPRSLYPKLLRKCLGDHEQAEKLIEAERQRYPNASRERLIRHAIERWEMHSH